MNGVITGGWSFVWAAYGITATAILLYTITLITRFRDEAARSDRT